MPTRCTRSANRGSDRIGSNLGSTLRYTRRSERTWQAFSSHTKARHHRQPSHRGRRERRADRTIARGSRRLRNADRGCRGGGLPRATGGDVLL